MALVALVIGGNTTIFSIAHGILTKPSPGVHADGLVTVSWIAANGDVETHNRREVYSHVVEEATFYVRHHAAHQAIAPLVARALRYRERAVRSRACDRSRDSSPTKLRRCGCPLVAVRTE